MLAQIPWALPVLSTINQLTTIVLQSIPCQRDNQQISLNHSLQQQICKELACLDLFRFTKYNNYMCAILTALISIPETRIQRGLKIQN